MKQILFIFILFVFFQFSAFAQFSEANIEIEGNGMMYFNLSIGTNDIFSTAEELLLNDWDKNGSCKMVIDDGIRVSVLGIDAFEKGITGTISAHDLQFKSGLFPWIHIESTGEVGVGTVTPSAALHVSDPGTIDLETELLILESDISNKPALLFSEVGTGNGKTMGIVYNGEGTGTNNKLQVINDVGTPIVTWTDGELMGIGTETPREELDVMGNVGISSVPGSVIFDNNNDDSELTFNGTHLTAESSNGSVKIQADRRVILRALGDEVIVDAEDEIRFQVDGTTEMYCKQSGNWGINKFNPSSRLHVKQENSLENIMIENDTDTDKWAWQALSNLFLRFNGDAVGVYDFDDGDYVVLSDRRLKEEIIAMKDGTLTSVLQLKPSSYYYKRDVDSKHPTIGFIAQELQEHFPALVFEDDIEDSDMLGVSYAGVGVVAVKAIQEQNAEFIKLKEAVLKQTIDESDIDQGSVDLADFEKRIEALKLK